MPIIFEPRHEKKFKRSSGFPNRSYTNRPVQSQKTTRSMDFWIEEETRDCTIRVAKTKALIGKTPVSHDAAQLSAILQSLLTDANCRPIFPIVTPPVKNTQESQDLTNIKSDFEYLENQNQYK